MAWMRGREARNPIKKKIVKEGFSDSGYFVSLQAPPDQACRAAASIALVLAIDCLLVFRCRQYATTGLHLRR
jgi:hypothetical protein